MVNMDAVWDRTMEFVSDNLGAVLAITIPFLFLPTAISGVIETPATQGGDMGRLIGQAVALVTGLVGLFGQVALSALALDPDGGAGQARSRGLRRLLPVIGVTLVIGLIFMVILLPSVLILAAYGFDFTAAAAGKQPTIPPAAAAWTGLYVLIALPVFIFLAARLVLVMPALVDAPVGLGAIGRSWALTRGLTLKIIGVIILFVVVSLFLTLGVGAGLGAALRLIAGGEGVWTVAGVATALVLALIATVLTVVQTAFLARLYKATVARQAPVPAPFDPVASDAG